MLFINDNNNTRVHKGIHLAVRQGENNGPFQEFLAHQKIVALTQTKNFERPSFSRVHSLYKYFFVQLYIIKLTLLCRFFDRDQTLLSLVWWPVFFPLMIILGICTSDATSLRRNWSPTVSRPHAASCSVNPSFAKSFSALPSIFCSMREIKRKH